MIFLVGNRKCSGSNHQIAKPRRPARAKVSSFDVVLTLGPTNSIGKRLGGAKAGHDDPTFRMFNGFQEISGLTQVIGPAISEIIIRTQVLFLNAWATALGVFSKTYFDRLWSPCARRHANLHFVGVHTVSACPPRGTMVDGLPRAGKR